MHDTFVHITLGIPYKLTEISDNSSGKPILFLRRITSDL